MLFASPRSQAHGYCRTDPRTNQSSIQEPCHHTSKRSRQQNCPKQLNITASYATPRSSVVCEAHLKTCGLHKAIMLSIRSIHHTPTLRSVRLPGAHMPTLAIKAKHPTHLPTLLCFEAATPGSHSTPIGICSKSFAAKEGGRFFEGQVRMDKTLSPTQKLWRTWASKK